MHVKTYVVIILYLIFSLTEAAQSTLAADYDAARPSSARSSSPTIGGVKLPVAAVDALDIIYNRSVAYFSFVRPFLPTADYMNGLRSRIGLVFNHLSSLSAAPKSSLSSMASNGNADHKASILNWADKSGEFKRKPSQFRNWISKEPGAQFPPEKDRYHLYVSYACPWAHRALIVRKLKGLEDFIPFTSVHWEMLEKGWRFATPDDEIGGENVTPDPLHPDFTHLRHIYFDVNPDYDGRFTVPTLYDKKQKTIVSNESADIIRMFYYAFDDLLPEEYKSLDLFPEKLRKDIEATNEWTYDDINNGVYKSGFATTQEAYEKAVTTLFKSLDRAEAHLVKNANPYYWGSQLTEGDIRLYTTICRFDAVYVQHFKTNLRDIRSGYPALHKWLRHLYWDIPAFHETTNFEHIKRHYTKSHRQINPHSITPLGPEPNILPKDEEVAAVRGH